MKAYIPNLSIKQRAILTAFGVLLLQGCSSSDAVVDEPAVTPTPDVPEVEQLVPVTFGIGTMAAETRTDGLDAGIQPWLRADGTSKTAATRSDDTWAITHIGDLTVIPKDKQVGVFGYYQGTEKWDSIYMRPDFFFNEPMTSQGRREDPVGSGNFSRSAYLDYSPLRFWPNGEGEMLSFYAYYPYVPFSFDSEGNGTGGSFGFSYHQNNTTLALGEFIFTVKDNASEQIDFMCSELTKNQLRTDHMTDDRRVPLIFYHKLSRILINIEIDEHSDFDKIKELKIEGVHKTGTFKADYMDLFAAWERPLIGSTLRNIGNVYVDQLPSSGSLTASEETALLLIPQRCEQESYFIKFKLQKKNEGPVQEFSFPLRDVWWAGREYIYNFTVDDENEVLDTTIFHGNAGTPVNGGAIEG